MFLFFFPVLSTTLIIISSYISFVSFLAFTRHGVLLVIDALCILFFFAFENYTFTNIHTFQAVYYYCRVSHKTYTLFGNLQRTARYKRHVCLFYLKLRDLMGSLKARYFISERRSKVTFCELREIEMSVQASCVSYSIS